MYMYVCQFIYFCYIYKSQFSILNVKYEYFPEGYKLKIQTHFFLFQTTIIKLMNFIHYIIYVIGKTLKTNMPKLRIHGKISTSSKTIPTFRKFFFVVENVVSSRSMPWVFFISGNEKKVEHILICNEQCSMCYNFFFFIKI